MKDTPFDKRLKASLDNLEVPYDPASWKALEQRLNAPFAEEHPAPVDSVDKALFRTLDRLESPYQPAHWDVLAGRLNHAARVRRLWIMKLSEAAIFLLLLVNLEGLLHVTTPQKTPLPQTPASPRLQAEAPSGHRRNGGAAGTGRIDPGSVIVNAVPAEEEYPASAAARIVDGRDNFGADPYRFIPENAEGSPSAATILLNPTETPTPEHWASLPDIVKLPLLLGNPLESAENRAFAAPVAQNVAPRQHRFYAATYAAYDWNHVSADGYAHSAGGYGGGMAIGYRIGKWGVEAGLAYNRKQYEPRREEEIYKGNTQNGYYGSYAKTVDADIVSVPVKATRQVGRFGQLTAHAVGGVTTNFAVDKSYHYASTYYPGSAPPDPNFSPGQQPQLRRKGRGLLENGALNGNAYVSADAGLRLEHPVGRHFVAFVEPVYRHTIAGKGIGPSPAKINTFSIQAGVLATL